jgi:hypothetical protein
MKNRKSMLFLFWCLVAGITIAFIGGWVFGMLYYPCVKLGFGWLAITILILGCFVGFLTLGLVVAASKKIPSIEDKEEELDEEKLGYY